MLSISLNSEENKTVCERAINIPPLRGCFPDRTPKREGGTASSAEKYFMNNLNRLPQNIQELHSEGNRLKGRILRFLDEWPLGSDSQPIYFPQASDEHKNAANGLIGETRA